MGGLIPGRRVLSAVVLPGPRGGKPYVWHADARGTGWTLDCPWCGSRAHVERSARRPMAVRCLGDGCGRWVPAP